MKRKTSTLPSRVYSYGCRTPTEGAVTVHTQLRLANRYYNDLIAIERERRDEYRKARSLVGTRLAALEAERATLTAEIDALRTALAAKRQEKKARVPATDSERAALGALVAKRKALYDDIRAARLDVRHDPGLVAAEKEIGERAQQKIKEKRKASGLYWGTYLHVERAVEAARKSSVDPRFHGFQGMGNVGVQLQKGIPVAQLFGKDSRIQIEPHRGPGPMAENTWSTRSGRRHAYADVRIRVGSDGRLPVWATFPVLIHRPLPQDARVKWAWIKVVKQGPRYHYELQLSLEAASFAGAHDTSLSRDRVAAINMGWRKLPDGRLRVGYLYDVFGATQELTLPAAIHEEISKASNVRGFNDAHFNTAKSGLGAWLKEHPGLIPEPLVEELKTLHAWNSRGRLARVADRLKNEMPSFVWKAWVRWRGERLEKQLDLFAEFSEIEAWLSGTPLEAITVYLDFWRKKEKHLWDMEASKRGRAIRRRGHVYRNIARELCQKYGVLVLEEMRLTEQARIALPEAETVGLASPVKNVMRSAAPNELRVALEAAFGKERIVRLKPKHTTVVHHGCGHLNASKLFEADRQAQVSVTCEGCGKVFDQDENAAKNLLALHLDGEPLAPEKAFAHG